MVQPIEEGEHWPYLVAAIVALPELVKFTASLLQRSRIGSPVPEELAGIYDQEESETALRYSFAKSTFGLCHTMVDLVVFFGFWLLGGFPLLDQFCGRLHLSTVWTGVVYIMLLMGLSQAMYLPWDIYFTFVLEEKFGFNKTTVATFIRDRVKAGLLAVLLGIPILAVVLWFLSSFGTGAWLWVWIFVSSVQVLLLFLMPVLLLPLFMEMIPLPDGQAIITEEAGEDGKALPPFLSGRVFYAKNDSAYATRDRRFTGAKVGDGLAVLPFVGGSWVISSGNGEKVETVHATSSEKGTQIAAGTRITFQLSEEVKQLALQGVEGQASGDPLVPAAANTVTAVCVNAGSLRTSLLSLANRLGYHGASIYVIDGSARSAHSNAFCTGFGSFRRICLFDTLLPLLSEDEILAVLGHEIGHDRMYHVHSMLVMSLAYFFVMMYALGHFLSSPALSAAFLAPEPKVYLMVIFFSIVWEPVDFFINLLMKVLSRFNEYQADRYSVAADKKYARLLGDSLKKMMRKSKVNLTPHPFHVFLNNSHPELDARLKAIRNYHEKHYNERM
ncbi:CAAX prenyl protease 1 (A-factor-converting enzyme) (Prenyl protein-specific endoprotease 1) (PPSEP 1) [Durusdinium trenchii]|uniref:Ste24 endopeptidase n=1 Tax=Durusdinium trenchii TaxID=1381693 RepID=A0ABP0QJF2_9DINO